MGNVNEACSAPCAGLEGEGTAAPRAGARGRPFGLPELEALKNPPLFSRHAPSNTANLPGEIDMAHGKKIAEDSGPGAPSPRFSQEQLKRMHEKQLWRSKDVLIPPHSPRFSQEQLREMWEEQQRNTGNSTTQCRDSAAVSIPLRLTVGAAGDVATSPRILVVMKTWSPDSTAPPVNAGEVCSLVKEGTNGWILVLRPTHQLAWIPKTYAQIEDAFSYKVPADVGGDICVNVPVPRPQADRLREAIAHATTKSISN